MNLGLAGAFQTGLRYAAENDYDCAIQLDADGQHKPEYIAAMLEELEDGADIVIGSRFLTVKKPKTLRMLGSYIISWSIRLTTGRAICDPTSGMRLFNRAMVEEFAQNLNYGPEPDTISYLIKNGAKVKEVQVEMGERVAGQSYLTFYKSIQYMVKMSISILLIQWFRKRDTETPYPKGACEMFDQTIIRVCLIIGSLVTAIYVLMRVRRAKVQIEDTIFWLLFSVVLLILAIFPGIATGRPTCWDSRAPSTLCISSSSSCCWPNSSFCPSASARWIPACASSPSRWRWTGKRWSGRKLDL